MFILIYFFIFIIFTIFTYKFIIFIKKGTLSQVQSREFCKIFKSTFFTEHLWAAASDSFSLANISKHSVNKCGAILRTLKVTTVESFLISLSLKMLQWFSKIRSLKTLKIANKCTLRYIKSSWKFDANNGYNIVSQVHFIIFFIIFIWLLERIWYILRLALTWKMNRKMEKCFEWKAIFWKYFDRNIFWKFF